MLQLFALHAMLSVVVNKMLAGVTNFLYGTEDFGLERHNQEIVRSIWVRIPQMHKLKALMCTQVIVIASLIVSLEVRDELERGQSSRRWQDSTRFAAASPRIRRSWNELFWRWYGS